ncbi:hypothetical protein [Roseiconus lacunae]|uniref:Uncharacterized protein n=1 Tax=Roseiconus lacunae TaxID=2605694 RepID=A0ABT7PF52_9BACT|nr:hypothetical protein [Roseiconus lacunae]MDM4015096.1 hypothetical protein [Roseiconus lacunae]
MIRTTTLATLSVLALFGCIATPASAQYVYGNLHDYSYSLDDHGHRDHYDSHHRYHHNHGDYHGCGHISYPNPALSRHHAIPAYAEAAASLYGNDAICREPIDCPLQRCGNLPHRLTDEYDYGFSLETPSHDHSHSGDSHFGHSHEGHSQDFQAPNRDVAPPDGGYIARPSLPRDSIGDFQPEQDFRREQPQRDDSIRMDSPPPPSLEPNSPSSPREGKPKRFDVPPPSTV